MTYPLRRGEISDVRADHKHIAVREINKSQHAIDHRIAERNQRVDRAERNAVDKLLKKLHLECRIPLPDDYETTKIRLNWGRSENVRFCGSAKFLERMKLSL